MTSDVPSPEPRHTGDDFLPARLRRFAPLIAVIAVGIVLFGFLSGIREPQETVRPQPVDLPAPKAIPRAEAYMDLPKAKIRPNASWEQSLAQLKFDKPGIFDPVIRTDEMKQAALADRAANRAYDSAPPTIPHPGDGLFAAACLSCHGEGIKVGDRIASKISHAYLSNCTQCHVENHRGGLPFNGDDVENRFVGVYRAGPGLRASPGAPPTIPHHTWMRENCTSCHGLVARPGIRTTHPWLSNCTQCHAASAALDQVEFAGARR